MRVCLGPFNLLPILVLGLFAGCEANMATNEGAHEPTGDTVTSTNGNSASSDSLTTIFPSDNVDESVPAHDFTLPGIGGEFRLSAQRGEVVVLNFWAMWNEPSVEGMEAMNRIHVELGSDGIAVVGVAQDEGGLDVLRDWAVEHEVAYPLVADASQSVAQRYGEIEFLPTTVIIDRDGMIRERHTGILTHDELLDLLGPILIEEDEPLSELPVQEHADRPLPISPIEVHRMVAVGAMLVDVRSHREAVASGTAVYAEHLPLHALASQDLPANFGIPIIFFGGSEDANSAAVRALEWGYLSVYTLSGGLAAWQAAGLPVMPLAPSHGEEEPLMPTRTVIG